MLIVSFDGNVYCGKTTTINYAKYIEGQYILNEYSPVVNQDLDILKIQELFIAQEAERKQFINTECSPGETIFIDRSILSILAYTYVRYKIGLIDIRKHVYQMVLNGLKKNSIVIPNHYVLFTSQYRNITERYWKYESRPMRKGTDPLLIRKEYIMEYDRFMIDFFRNFSMEHSLIIQYSNDRETYQKIKQFVYGTIARETNEAKFLEALKKIYFN